MMVDYHVHALAHGEYSYSLEWLASFVEQARLRGIKEIGFSEHDEFLALVDEYWLEETRRQNLDMAIKLGLEVDYQPGLEDDIRLLSKTKPFDYLMGSIHFIDDWAFDHPDYQGDFANYDIDEIYRKYFSLIAQAAQSNLFDLIGHFDLIKIWGHRPRKNILQHVEAALVSIKEADLVVEINSAGLRKPVAEIYPQYEIIAQMRKMDIPITFGSDAHHPSQVGMDLEKNIALAKKAGYNKIITFQNRDKIIVPLE